MNVQRRNRRKPDMGMPVESEETAVSETADGLERWLLDDEPRRETRGTASVNETTESPEGPALVDWDALLAEKETDGTEEPESPAPEAEEEKASPAETVLQENMEAAETPELPEKPDASAEDKTPEKPEASAEPETVEESPAADHAGCRAADPALRDHVHVHTVVDVGDDEGMVDGQRAAVHALEASTALELVEIPARGDGRDLELLADAVDGDRALLLEDARDLGTTLLHAEHARDVLLVIGEHGSTTFD